MKSLLTKLAIYILEKTGLEPFDCFTRFKYFGNEYRIVSVLEHISPDEKTEVVITAREFDK